MFYSGLTLSCSMSVRGVLFLGMAPEEGDFLGWSSLTPPLQLSGYFTAGHPLTLRVNPSPGYPGVRISCVFVQSVIILVHAVTTFPQWVLQTHHLSEVSGMSSSPLWLVSFGFVCKLKLVWGFGLVPCTSLPVYHGITASSGTSTCFGMKSLLGCRWITVPPWSFTDRRGPAASPRSVPWAAEKPLLWHQQHLLPSFLTDLGVCRAVSFTYLHSSLKQQLCSFGGVYYHFLNSLFQRCYHCCWAWPLPVVGPAWSKLALALWDMGKLLAASHRSQPCISPTTMREFSCQTSTNWNLFFRGHRNLLFLLLNVVVLLKLNTDYYFQFLKLYLILLNHFANYRMIKSFSIGKETNTEAHYGNNISIIQMTARAVFFLSCIIQPGSLLLHVKMYCR